MSGDACKSALQARTPSYVSELLSVLSSITDKHVQAGAVMETSEESLQMRDHERLAT